MCNLFIIRMASVVFNELYPERLITFEPVVHVAPDSIFLLGFFKARCDDLPYRMLSSDLRKHQQCIFQCQGLL